MANILLNMFENSIPVSVIIMILILLRGILNKRYTAKWQYWVWVVITIRLLVPFDISIPNFTAPVSVTVPNPVVYERVKQDIGEENPYVSDDIESEQNYADAEQYVGADIIGTENAGNAVEESNPSAVPQNSTDKNENVVIKNENSIYRQNIFGFIDDFLTRSSIKAGDVLLFVWVCGSCLLFAVRLGGYFIAASVLRRSCSPFAVDLSDSKAKLNIDAEIDVYSSPMVTTPVLSGIFSPTIVVPEDSTDDIYLQIALYHELVHYKRCDIALKLMLFVATCLYWYNPFVWLMNSMAMEDIEYTCDETVYKSMNENGKALYGESILKFAAKKKEELLYSTSFSNDKKTLAQRLKNIFAKNKKRSGIAALCFIVLLSVAGGFLISVNMQQADTPLVETLVEIGPEDTAAIELIKLYENCSEGKNYDMHEFNEVLSNRDSAMYYKINPYIFAYLSKNKVPYDLDEAYVIMDGDYPALLNTFFETAHEVVDDDVYRNTVQIFNTYDHNPYSMPYGTSLVSVGKINSANGDVIYSFERRHNNEVIGYVDYTLVPYTVKNVPDILDSLLTAGDTFWKIKTVKGVADIRGGEEKIVYISTPQELAEMSEDYAVNGNLYRNYTYILTNDIDMEGVDFKPIGCNTAESNDDRDITVDGFCSVFDGRGYTIKNITFDYDNMNHKLNKLAPFAIISEYGTVKNLNIENINIRISPSTYGVEAAGFACGVSGVVENCYTQGRIEAGGSGAGGFAYGAEGKNTTIIRNCSADVELYGLWNVAGFITSSYVDYLHREVPVKIISCSSYGSVTGREYAGMPSYDYIGQIAGFVSGASNTVFENCHLSTPIYLEGNAKFVGSFVANTDENTVYNNCTYNPVTSSTYPLIGLLNWQKAGDYSKDSFTTSTTAQDGM
ncbi:MAG: hypothetical protein IKB62_06180 [Oscillospiraceae bacterium]|nr:hypothetical protein [Oscillospiraceae bacterium]